MVSSGMIVEQMSENIVQTSKTEVRQGCIVQVKTELVNSCEIGSE